MRLPNYKVLAAVSAALFIAHAHAQTVTVPNHAVPVGKGPGVTGFNSAAPLSNTIFVSQGPSADPVFTATLPFGLNIGNATPTFGSGFNITSIGNVIGGDWVAAIERQGFQSNNELLFRIIHHSDFVTTAAPSLPIIAMFGDRGTKAAPVALAANDYLAVLDGRGYDGTGWSDTSAQLSFQAAGAWSATSHPSKITLKTTPSGSTNPISSVFIDSDQSILFTGPNATLTANGQASVGVSSAGGAGLKGRGSVSDITIYNKNGTSVCSNPTGTTTLNCNAVNVATLNNVTISFSTGTLAIANGATLTDTSGQTSGNLLRANGSGGFSSITPGSGVATALGIAVDTSGGFQTKSRSSWGGSCGAGGVSQGTTVYCPAPPNQLNGSNLSLTAATVMPYTGTIRNLYAVMNTGPGGVQTFTSTIFKNGSSTALTCQITGSATTCNDITHSFTFAAGDYVSLQVVSSATATNNATLNFGVQIETP